MTPYYEQDGITIYHGDCREILPTLTFDAVVTDPPYGMGHYATDTAALTPDLLHRFINSGTTSVFGYPERLVGLCVAASVVPDEWITWWATNAAAKGFNIHGLWKEVECIAVFGPTLFAGLREDRSHKSGQIIAAGYMSQDTRLSEKSNGQRRVGDVWTEASPGLAFNSGDRLHPNEKPLGVMLRLIQATPGDVTLDPFMGSGTTLRAAKDLGRQAIGIEIEERYCEIAATRLAQGVLDFGGAA